MAVINFLNVAIFILLRHQLHSQLDLSDNTEI